MQEVKNVNKSKSKTYTTSEIAKKLNVSVSTITRFAQKQNINPVVITQNNAKHYHISDFENLRKTKKTRENKSKKTKNDALIEQLNIRLKDKQAQIEELKNTIDILQKQLIVKDEQISTANRIADQAQQLDLTTHQQSKTEPKAIEGNPNINKKHGLWYKFFK